MDADRLPFPVESEVLDTLGALWTAGYGAYLVGGGVRDALLGQPVSDWDVATNARPPEILRAFPGSTYQNRFGTVLARGIEITTFRRDHRYADHRRPDAVTFSQDIFEDLARRDLTINAIAWGSPSADAAPRLVDPADGQGDLAARLVRAVGDPHLRFDEDALRLLRAVRIAARLRFEIEPLTWAAMVDHAGDIKWVSGERVGGEIRRMLAAEQRLRAIELLHASGILASTVPELVALPQSSYEHTLATLEATSEVPGAGEWVRLGALFSEVDAEEARAALLRLRFNGRDADVCDRIAPEHLQLSNAEASDLAGRLRHFGGLFVGGDAAEVLGDYGAGPNHTLPTGGTARRHGGLSVMDFIRWTTELVIERPEEATALAADAEALARLEGLVGHARAAARRTRGT